MTKERLIEHLSHLMRLGAQNPDLSDRGEWLLTALQERVLTIVSSADETGVVYRKWPGEPPHCMSCDCGMTDEQKRTVPFEDYQTFHTALMGIVFESKSFTEAVKLASDALSHKPPAKKANERRGTPEEEADWAEFGDCPRCWRCAAPVITIPGSAPGCIRNCPPPPENGNPQA